MIKINRSLYWWECMLLTNFLFCSSALAASCASHAWYTHQRLGVAFSAKKYQVDENYLSYVSDKNIAQAERLLKVLPAVEITQKQANYLAGYKVWIKKNTNLYLVRGLRDHPAAKIRAYYFNRKLEVRSFIMGGPVDNLIVSPIIVSLPALPEKVSVFCAGAY